MATISADLLVDTIHAWGVDVVFGLPGDGINGVMEALRKKQDKIRFIQVRHEEAAAFMACGYAKFTGRLGCCLATSGPGGLHLLNGLYDAKLDGAPVLAITGQQFHDLVGTHTQQDVPLDRVFMDVALYNERIMGPSHVQHVAELACRTALAYRGVAHITFPVDLQEQTVEEAERSKRNIEQPISDVFTRGVRLPEESDLRRATEILNKGRKIAILAGRGALGAGDELEQIAELLGAPIIKPLLGKACVPDDSPYTTGGVGLLGTKPSVEAMEECDTLLIVGSSFPYLEYYPKDARATAVQIDTDPIRLGIRYAIDAGLVGDSKRTLQALIPLLKRKDDRSFLEKAQSGMKKWRAMMETRGSAPGKPMKPQVVAKELGQRLPSNAIVCADSGTVTAWWAQHIDAKKGQMHSVSGNLASMACGLPYAIAAQFAYPDRPVVAFVGDGGLSMLMAELATCVKYRLPVKIVVVKNNTLGQIKWEQVIFLGNPEYGCELQPIDFAMAARAFGMTSYFIDDPDQCGPTLDRALATDGPVLVEAVVDPHMPPMPPKVEAEDALHLAESLARGTPDRAEITKTIVKDKIRELV